MALEARALAVLYMYCVDFRVGVVSISFAFGLDEH